MKNRLLLRLIPITHPYADEPSSAFEIWGRISMEIGGQSLLNWQWDILEVVEWFFTNKEYLLYETPTEPPLLGNCLAEHRNLLFEKIDVEHEAEDYVDTLWNFFARHIFHLRGTDTPHFYIGIDEAGVGEISFKEAEGQYCFHKFDMPQFIANTEREIYAAIQRWRHEFQTIQGMQKLLELEAVLGVRLRD